MTKVDTVKFDDIKGKANIETISNDRKYQFMLLKISPSPSASMIAI